MDLLERITAGTKDILVMNIETKGYEDSTLEYRKLSINEQKHYKKIINKALGKVSTIEKQGFRGGRGQEAKAEMDIAESGEAEYQAELYLVKTSLTIDGKERLTKDQIETMDAPLFEEIVEKLKKINGLDTSANNNIENDIKK